MIAVLNSRLEQHLRLLAVVLAMHADDDGRNIFPGLPTLMDFTGLRKRAIREQFRELHQRAVLFPDGYHVLDKVHVRIRNYRLDLKNLAAYDPDRECIQLHPQKAARECTQAPARVQLGAARECTQAPARVQLGAAHQIDLSVPHIERQEYTGAKSAPAFIETETKKQNKTPRPSIHDDPAAVERVRQQLLDTKRRIVGQRAS